MIKSKRYLGRLVSSTYSFKVNGTFESMYAAERWCIDHGYSTGSLSKDRKTCRSLPIAIVFGEYCLPQKWNNFTTAEKALVDGVMVSDDFREGEVIIYIFN